MKILGILGFGALARKQEAAMPDLFGDYQVIGEEQPLTLQVCGCPCKRIWGCEINGVERKGISCGLRGTAECPAVENKEAFEKWLKAGFPSAPPFSIKRVLVPDDQCPMDFVSCL
ncbi:MAG: hypothetical protein PHP25_04525 [Candidatus Moranbacteria bacterium]|nr:hypothetical protein [Candidatus Moranbacteria bacterium]